MSEHSMTLVVEPFTYHPVLTKETAVKILEEAAEVYSAWENMNKVCAAAGMCCNNIDCRDSCEEKAKLSEEIADCITVCVNFASLFDIDLQRALDAVHNKNEIRGYYS